MPRPARPQIKVSLNYTSGKKGNPGKTTQRRIRPAGDNTSAKSTCYRCRGQGHLAPDCVSSTLQNVTDAIRQGTDILVARAGCADQNPS